jgi:signal transduction histidine kinase
MSSESKIVYWLGSAAEKKATEELRTACRKAGFRNEWLQVDEKTDFSVANWTQASLPAPLSALVWLGGAPEAFSRLVAALKAESPPRAQVPVVLAGGLDLGALSAFQSSGADDLFLYGEAPDAFVLRLTMRTRAAKEKDDLRLQLRELMVKTARTETVVKQREEFLGVAAHDLRSPLGLIQASLGMVIDQAGKEKTLNPVHLELLTRAKRQSVSAINLVNDLLDVMAFEQGLKPDYRVVNLHEVLEQFYGDYRLKAEEKKVNFHYQNAIQDWRVLADSDRLNQLLQNLFVNALKFTDSGKNIFLTVEPFVGRRKTDPPYPMVVISVKDEGKGIPPRELQRIFDRFAQLRDQHRPEGRGLGLTVAKQISTLHDGNIWVQSVEGKGSVFHVLLPHVISRVNADTSKAGKRLLIVESSPERREVKHKLLEEWGFESHFVKDGVSAIAMAFYEPPAAILFGSELGLISEPEMVNMLKNEPAASKVPLLRLIPSGVEYKKRDDVLIDAFLDLPLNRAQLETVLTQVGLERLVTRKKAA